jgi:hypothetical protein
MSLTFAIYFFLYNLFVFSISPVDTPLPTLEGVLCKTLEMSRSMTRIIIEHVAKVYTTSQ